MNKNVKKILSLALALMTVVVCAFGVFAAPATADDAKHIIKGANIADATAYELYEKVGSTYTLKTTGSSINFDLSSLNLSLGEHTFVVRATATGYTPSDYSNEVTYTQKATLATPTLTNKSSASVCKFTFAADSNATGYEIYVNGVKTDKYDLTTSSGTVTVTMDHDAFGSAGSYQITVKAVTTKVYYIDSELSSAITFSKQKLATPVITLE